MSNAVQMKHVSEELDDTLEPNRTSASAAGTYITIYVVPEIHKL